MERTLWQPERLAEFGPNPFLPSQDTMDEKPFTEEIRGARPRVLKAAVQAKCQNIPGIYGMLDEHGSLIYVGKSKQLRTRLLSYFSPKVKNKKPGRLIRQARTLLWEPAPSEFAALLRELQLIQQWLPRFNVKDMPHRGRAVFLFLGRPSAPGVLLGSKPGPHTLATYGPIWGGRKLQRAVEALNRLFLLRDCPNSQNMAFLDQSQLFDQELRPGCLRYEMQTCLGPCVRGCTQEAYFQKIAQTRQFLEGKTDQPLMVLQQKMEQAARDQQFELAARLRDDWTAVWHLQDRLNRLRAAEKEFHFVYPITSDAGETLWYFIRGGRVAAVAKAPEHPQSGRAVSEFIDRTFSPAPHLDDLANQRPDTLLLVTNWFQQNPAEREQILTPKDAKTRCQLPRRPR